MNEKVKQLKDQIEQLKDKVLKYKDSDALKSYLDMAAKFHKYSFYNCLLIFAQLASATKVAGYKAWLKLDRHVKRGEHSIKILAPCLIKVKDEETKEEKKTIKFFRAVSVFDVSQTEGKKLPNWNISTPEQQVTIYNNLLNVMKKDKISVSFINHLRPYGQCYGNKVEIRKEENTATKFTTLIHEYAHQLLHQKNKEKIEKLDLTTEDKEIEAETTAYIVCKHFSIKHDSAKYLAIWLKKDNPFPNLERIQKASSEIINKITLNEALT